MRKITVITGTRAEYGLLKNTMNEIKKHNDLELQLIVTGGHLSKKYGNTVDEIEKDGFNIDEKIYILMDGNSKINTAKEMGLAMIEFAGAFNRLSPDIILILGDRYEIFAAASTAMAMNIPIAHISGGEVTEGAMDEQIRHAITKLAHIHFPGAKIYAENIIKMGEEPWRVFNVGDPGIENIKTTKLLNKMQIQQELDVEVNEDTLLVTYHPVTLEIENLEMQIDNLIKALDKVDRKMIITYPNSDNGGNLIIDKLVEFKNKNNKVYLHKNLGTLKYLSVMKLCGAIVGNSSSALVEAPFLKKAVVNIGNRQKGRLMADNIINCNYNTNDIELAINKCFTKEFKKHVSSVESLYGEGNTSIEIVKVLKSIKLDEKILKKRLVWGE